MKRLLALAFVLVLYSAATLPEVRAQPQVNLKATVDYIDPATKKKVEVTGQIVEEGPGGVKIKEGGKDKQIPALAITHITYSVPDITPLEFREGFTKETRALEKTRAADKKAGLEEAVRVFQGLSEKLRGVVPVHRYFQYKIAVVKLEIAQTEPENKAALKAAMTALSEFKDRYPTGWQIVPALTTLARLQEEQGNLNAAREAYEALTRIADAPPELKREGELQVALMYLRARDFTQAEPRLNTLYQATPANDPQRGLLQVYLAEVQLKQKKLDGVEDKLKSAIASSSDTARVRAAAHNLLGDYYCEKNDDESAVWEYLKVDLLYNQDKDEHAKALYHLWKLFAKQGNSFRAQQCLERLRDKDFVGNEYHTKAQNEKPPMK